MSQPTDAAPTPPPGYTPYPQPPKRGGFLGRLFGSLLTAVLLISLVLNVYLAIFVYSMTGGPSEIVYERGDRDHRIVILPIDGLITDDTYHFVRDALQSLENDLPAAVVLRIDSQGGGVGASDRLWNRLRAFKEEHQIPIVASFGSIATSGGYYVAMPADTIFAENTTLTGSIGVMSPGFTIHELLENVGVTPEVIISSESTKKDRFSILRPWTDEERAERQEMLEPAYERFVEVIHQGRGQLLDEDQIRDAATGEIFTAQRALDRQLVDSIGYLQDAIDAAKDHAGIDAGVSPHVTRMRRPQSFGLGALFHSGQPDLSQLSGQQLRELLIDMTSPRLMYAMPDS